MQISGVERDAEGMSKEGKGLHCNKIFLSRRGFFFIYSFTLEEGNFVFNYVD